MTHSRNRIIAVIAGAFALTIVASVAFAQTTTTTGTNDSGRQTVKTCTTVVTGGVKRTHCTQ